MSYTRNRVRPAALALAVALLGLPLLTGCAEKEAPETPVPETTGQVNQSPVTVPSQGGNTQGK